METSGLKHDDQRLNVIANDQSRATPSLRSDNGHRKGSVKCVRAVVPNLVCTGKFKLEHHAQAGNHRFDQFVGAKTSFSLDVRAQEWLEHGLRTCGLNRQHEVSRKTDVA